jgi:cytochrome c oxidase subunit 2
MAGLGFALVLILVTVVTVAACWGRWWWLPVDISVLGPAVDHQFSLALAVTGVIFVLAQLGLALAAWRYREGKVARQASARRGNSRLEAAWTLASAILFIGSGLVGYRVWADMYLRPTPPGALRVEVQGEQFAYSFRYPGPDGRFGPMHVEKINDATGNLFGLDRARDPDSRDDIVTATLGIPVGRPVELLLRARDVGHSFAVRELRIQQDLLPGMEFPLHFTATATGTYEIICTQLCGLGHYRMRAFLKVMPETEFERWLQSQAAAQ